MTFSLNMVNKEVVIKSPVAMAIDGKKLNMNTRKTILKCFQEAKFDEQKKTI